LEGNSMTVPQPFLVLATQNPIEQEGTYPLPEAQLDRYLLKVLIEYPQADDELRMVRQISEGRVGDALDTSAVSALAGPESILAMQQQAAAIRVDEAVARYAVELVRQTRDWPGISAGAGPRGGLALLRAARAQALLNGRDFVTPDDIKQMVPPALRHRITLAPEMELEGRTADQMLFGVLDRVAAPRT
ncbi:MAG: AAA family ATPase, partial [Gammaproteobacteria bacterium]